MSKTCNFSVGGFLTASFKGVSFPVKNSSSSGGRRGAIGEFPLSENIDYADLGAKAERFSFSGTFSGKYHREESLFFYHTCRSKEPGALVHPSRGVLFVACVSVTINNDLYEGLNTTDYNVEFVEAPINLTFDNIFKLVEDISISIFMKKFISTFNNNYKFQSLLWMEQDSIRGTFNNVIDGLREAYMSESIADSTTKWQIVQNIVDIPSSAIIKQAKEVSTIIYNIIAFIFRDSVQDPNYKMFLCKQLLNKMNIDSATKNGNLIVCYVRVILLVQWLALYKNAKKVNSDDLDQVIKYFDIVFKDELNVLQELGMHELYHLVFNFRIKVLKFFYNLYYYTKNKVEYIFNYSAPPLVAAWEIYGDSTKVGELRALNAVDSLVIENKVTAIV